MIRCREDTPSPRSTANFVRPANRADAKPPATTPRSSSTSQSCSGVVRPFVKYGAVAGEDDTRALPSTAAIPVATIVANAPDAPRPRPADAYAASSTSPIPTPATYGSV